MKRTVIVMFAMAVLLPANALAQEPAACALNQAVPKLSADGTKSVEILLNELSADYKFALVFKGEVDLGKKFRGSLPESALTQRLTNLLKATEGIGVCDGNSFVIYSPEELLKNAKNFSGANPSPTPSVEQPRVVPAPPSPEIIIPAPSQPPLTMVMPRFQPVPCDQQSWLMWAQHTATAQQHEAYRNRRNDPGYNPYLYGDRPCNELQRRLSLAELNSQVGIGISSVDSYPAPTGIGSPLYSPIFTEGSIKTTGDVGGVELYVEGCYIGDANQFNNWYNQKAAAVSHIPLLFTARRKDGRAFSRTVVLSDLFADWRAGAKHLPFGIEDWKFDPKNAGSFLYDAAKDDEMNKLCRNSPHVIR